MANTIGTLSFVSSKQKITINLKGINNVSVDFGTEIKNYDLNKNKDIIIEHDFGNTESHHISISNAQNITEVDISSNEINNINLHLCTLLKKFVAYNNNICSLNFANSNALQYVHIQNNPMCNSKPNMKSMINSLPDRNNKAFGSIIMYDFVPPRQMDIMTEDQISIRELRRELENTSIPKDWYFGSAIIYDEAEYAKCMNIKDSHVTDVWESAEYGEGLVVSSKEQGCALNHPEIESGRILEHKQFNTTNNPNALIDKTSSSITQDDYQTHGTKTSSAIGASNKMYGVLPRCKFKLFDSNVGSVNNNEEFFNLYNSFYNDSTIDIVYLSQAARSVNDATKYIEGLSNNNKRLVFVSSANDGDSVLNTDDHTLTQYPGYHSIKDKKSMFFVGGIANDNIPYILSFWCQDINITEKAFCYAPSFSNTTKEFTYRYFNGTSYSAPLMAGYAGIIQILFTKKYGKKPTITELKNEIFRRCNPLKQYHTYKVGNGRIDFSTYNDIENSNILVQSIQTEDSITMDLYSKHKLQYEILPDNANNSNITIESTDNNIVQISEENTLFALNEGSCEIVVFSNDGSVKKNIPVTVNNITEAVFEKENSNMIGKFEKENFVSNGEWVNSIEGNDIKLNTFDVDSDLNITSVNGYLEIPYIKTNFTVSFYIKNLISLKYGGRIFSLYNYNENEFFVLDFVVSIKTVNSNDLMNIGLVERDVNGKSYYANQYYNATSNFKNIFNQEDMLTFVFNRDTQRIIIYLDGNKFYEENLTSRMPSDLKLCIGNSFLHDKAVVGTNISDIKVFNKALSNDEVVDNVARQLKIINNIAEKEDEVVEYKGSVTLISGLTQANNGEFPLVDGSAVQYKEETNEDGSFKSLVDKIDELSGDQNNYATNDDIDSIISDLFGQ